MIAFQTKPIYFYEILKFCDRIGPLEAYNGDNKLLNIEEFKLKYGFTDNKTISQRNRIFRRRNLQNACL